jgi:TfoX/Sxy family transcriptional regulator of competence genes
MAWTKIPKEHEPLFLEVLPDDPRVEAKAMFGSVVGMVNGRMFCGLWDESMMVRLSPEDLAEVLAMGGEPFDPMGRGANNHMVVLPATVMRDREELRAWLRKAMETTAALPPKAKKGTMRARKAAAKKTSAKPASAKKTSAKKTSAKKTSAKPPAAKKAAARPPTAKKAGANRAGAAKAAPKKVAAKKTSKT